MKLFVLRVKDHLLTPKGADAVGYSEWSMPRGLGVVAIDELVARSIASKYKDGGGWWLDDQHTTCEAIDLSGPARVIIANEPTG